MKPMSILLVEDDKDTCKIFEKQIKSRNDTTLVGVTDSSYEAINLVKLYSPDVVILDLYLHQRNWFGNSFFKKSQNIAINR